MKKNKLAIANASTEGDSMQENNDDVFDFLKQPSKEEISSIVILLKNDLNELFKNKNKRYSKYHAGFSRFPLTLHTLQEACYKGICQEKDRLFTEDVNKLIFNLLKGVRDKLRSNDISLDKINVIEDGRLINILLETPFKRQLQLYFRLNEIELTEHQEQSLLLIAHSIEQSKIIEKRLKREISAEYKMQKQELEEKYRQFLRRKEEHINENEEKIKQLIDSWNEERDRYNKIVEQIRTKTEENEKLKLLLTEKKELETEYKSTIDNLQNEIAERKRIQCIIEKNDLDLLVGQLVKELEKDNLREKFFTFLEKEGILQALIRNHDIIYNDFCNEARQEWEAQYQELIFSKNKLNNEVGELCQIKEKLDVEISGLTYKQQELMVTITTLEDKTKKFIEAMDDEIYNHLLNKSILKPLLNPATLTTPIKQSLYVKDSIVHGDNVTEDDIEEFVADIADNLSSIGIDKKISDYIGCLIVGCICSGLVPLIYGYKTRDIASAIAAAFAGCSPQVVTLPVGFSDAVDIVDRFHNSDANVVLFEDAVGNMNENSLLPLLREWTSKGVEKLDKLLLLSTESNDSIKYMSDNLLNYVVVITVQDFRFLNNGKFMYKNAKEALVNLINGKVNKKYSGKISVLTQNTGLNKLYNLQRAEIMECINEFSSDDTALEAIAILEMLTITKARGALGVFSDNVRGSEINHNVIDLVEKELRDE